MLFVVAGRLVMFKYTFSFLAGHSKTSEFKLFLPGNGEDIEKMIVDNCSNETKEALTVEV